MRYQTAPLPDDPPLGPIVALANPLDRERMTAVSGVLGDIPRNTGGPGRIRTYNLAVMSGRLYR